MESSVINRDLVRWGKHRWGWSIVFLFAVEIALLFSLARPLNVRTVYPSDPVLELPSSSGSKSSGEWLELEDPMLFAAPSWKGVSALAWMKRPEIQLAPPREFPRFEFLSYGSAKKLMVAQPPRPATSNVVHHRPPIETILPVLPPPSPPRVSKLEFEGFGNRSLPITPELPVQHYNDALRPTILQAGIDPAGTIFASRVIRSSGSKVADASALNISRILRFEPLHRTAENPAEISWGKLIFEWHALDLDSTNRVQR